MEQLTTFFFDEANEIYASGFKDRVFSALEQLQLPVIRSPYPTTCDAAIVSGTVDMNSSRAARFYTSQSRNAPTIPFSIKIVDAEDVGHGRMRWTIRMTAEEKREAQFILVFHYPCKMIALIPGPCIDGLEFSTWDAGLIRSTQVNPVLVPYLVRTDHLKQAFDGWRRAAGPIPHTLSTMMSLPSLANVRADTQLEFIYNAMSQHQGVDFDFCSMPMMADFHLKIKDRIVFFKTKFDHYTTLFGPGANMVHDTNTSGELIAFHKHQQWDYLFTQSSKHNEVYVVPHNVIPDLWYETERSWAHVPLSTWSEYRIKLDNNGDWVKDLLRIIENRKPPRSNLPRPETPAHLPLDHNATAVPGPKRSLLSQNVSYIDHIKSVTHEYMSLLDACAELYVIPETSIRLRLKANIEHRGRGLIFPLADTFILPNGKEARPRPDQARFFIMPYTWSDQDIATFILTRRLPTRRETVHAPTNIVVPFSIIQSTSSEDESQRLDLKAVNFLAHRERRQFVLFCRDDCQTEEMSLDTKALFVPSGIFASRLESDGISRLRLI